MERLIKSIEQHEKEMPKLQEPGRSARRAMHKAQALLSRGREEAIPRGEGDSAGRAAEPAGSA